MSTTPRTRPLPPKLIDVSEGLTMSSTDFDRLEALGVNAALERCGTLARQIENALEKDFPLRDTAALGEVHAALSRAVVLLDLTMKHPTEPMPEPSTSQLMGLSREHDSTGCVSHAKRKPLWKGATSSPLRKSGTRVTNPAPARVIHIVAKRKPRL